MKKRSLSCLSAVVLTLLVLVCLSALAAGLALYRLPDLAERRFGPPKPGLGQLQLTYLSAKLLLRADDLLLPFNAYGNEQPFTIALGESPSAVAKRLQGAGLIGDAEVFRTYLIYAGLDTTIQAGEYLLQQRMTPLEIAHTLQDATPREVTVNILPGWRLEEIAATLPTSGLAISPQAFLEAASSPPEDTSFLSSLPQGTSLEGFLLPGSYRVSRELSAPELIAVFLKNFQQQLDNEIQRGFERQGLTLFQAVTLASIVQREAVKEDEMPIIASVFYNRLAAGLKLDSDPTVQFALGFNPTQDTWWTNPLSLDDLQIDSLYNTYQHPGLPPGPIANPSPAALRAVAFPAQTPYYYFRAACDGSGEHVFSETFQEHVQKGCP